MVGIQILFTNMRLMCTYMLMVCLPLLTYDWLPVKVNCDGCHMWERKYSLFPEHMIVTPFGEFMISPILYL